MENDKKKIKVLFASYSHRIVVYLFWLYFLIFILLFRELPIVFKYVFFLFTGVYLGYKLALWALKVLKKENHFPTHKLN